MGFKVKYVDLRQSYLNQKEEIDTAINRVMMNGSFILRDDVSKFEERIASFIGTEYAVGVNSGTDALILSCIAAGLKENDEVITVGHTFVATVAAIHHCGAKPVLVDIDKDFNIDINKIEERITNKTKAIIPVHLNGRSCNMDSIMHLAKKYDLIVIEDACQSVGAKFNNQNVGTFGLFSCFSLHPMKSLNCSGDGGYITTNNKELYERLLALRNNGQSLDKTDIYEFGYSSRLDNLQAAIANIRLNLLHQNNNRRREIATIYNKELQGLAITLPQAVDSDNRYYDVFNSYVIQVENRDELYSYLRDKGIEVFTHIPKPLSEYSSLNLEGEHLSTNKIICKKILSLPIYPELSNEDLKYTIAVIKEFYK